MTVLLRQETTPRLVLRAVVLLAPVLALLAAGPADRPRGWFLGLTLVLSVAFAAMPESALGTACLGMVIAWWAVAGGPGVPWSAMPAALLLVAAHVASVLLSYGPTGMPLGPVLGRWLRRGALVALPVPLVWLFARMVDGRPEPPGIWVAGLGCAVVLCVVAATALPLGERS